MEPWASCLLKETKDAAKAKDRLMTAKERDVEAFLFGDVLVQLRNQREGNREITSFFRPVNKAG